MFEDLYQRKIKLFGARGKSTKTIYRLLNRKVLEDYVYLEKSGRVLLIHEPPNKISLKKKIIDNIQLRSNNTFKE